MQNVTTLNGTWTFDMYGYISDVSMATGYLFAKAYQNSTGTLMFQTANDDEDIGTVGSYHHFSWSHDAPNFTFNPGERFYIEIRLEITAHSSISEQTINPDFDSNSNGWAYQDWWDGSLGYVDGLWSPMEGNPGGAIGVKCFRDDMMMAYTGHAGYWEQPFCPSVNPHSATLSFDWRCGFFNDVSFGAMYVFVDTFSGDPVMGTQVWEQQIYGVTGWNSVIDLDMGAIVDSTSDYFLKVVVYSEFPGGGAFSWFEGWFDNVQLTWEYYPQFILGYDHASTPSSLTTNLLSDTFPPEPATNVRAELDPGTNHVTIYWNPSPSADVDHYEVWYRMNLWDPAGDTYFFRADVGLSTSYQHINAGDNSPNSYYWQLRTYDTSGHEARTQVQAVKIGSLLSTSSNPTGWFLLGLSLDVTNKTIESVLQTIIPGTDHVMLYRNGQWLHWTPYWHPSLNTLTHILPGEAFWTHLTGDDGWAVAGRITDYAIPMDAGWTLVSYPFAEKVKSSGNIMSHLVANCPYYNQMEIADTTRPYFLATPAGTEIIYNYQGFWIHVTADTTWNVINY